MVEGQRRVRVPLFPLYGEVRHLLRVWTSWNRKQVTAFHTALAGLRGTPQNPVDWSAPDEWIPKRLSGDNRELARAIWKDGAGGVNPRYTTGHWLLCQKYDLLRDGETTLDRTENGDSFVKHEYGQVEAFLDEQEGIFELLRLIALNGPVQYKGILKDWESFLSRSSNFRAQSAVRDTLRRRLRNVLFRSLVKRESLRYLITQEGREYVRKYSKERPRKRPKLDSLVRQRTKSIRKQLKQELLNLDPIDFEHLIRQLLEEMDYQNVDVTKASGDGGVDVIGEIELGITSVTEVVQAKRHKRPIQRRVLDALRGSLHRFKAVRGTIITTSRFSRGTEAAAFEQGAAPITLVDGEKLIDLLIKHEIGVKKKKLEILEFDQEAFANLRPRE